MFSGMQGSSGPFWLDALYLAIALAAGIVPFVMSFRRRRAK